MPSALCRLCPCPCPCPGCWPRGFGGRRPPRLLLRPPPPEGLPGPAFIVLSKFLLPDFDSYQFLPDSNCALGESSCPASAAALGPLPGARLRNRVPYAVRTHKCRAHIWAQSPTLETTLFCANQTDLFAYRFSDFGSVAPPREGLAWKACAGTRPNENTLILLAPAARRKGHRGGLLHRRTWLVEMASGFGYRTGGGGNRLSAGRRGRDSHPRGNISCPLLRLQIHTRRFFFIQMHAFRNPRRRLPLPALMSKHQLMHGTQKARLPQQHGLGFLIQRNHLQHFLHWHFQHGIDQRQQSHQK